MPTILGTSGDTELLIDVVSTTLVADTVQVVLRLDEIDALVDRLLTEKARARFLSAPVVKQVAA
jgi:D-arabinose 1-dehydrogenase-like Zn-dependent alcohol dehydrogenase